MSKKDKTMSAQERLEQLGYKQELNRSLSVTGNVTMTTANASPIMAIFVLAIAPLVVTGTATAGAALFQGILVLLIGLTLAELGSIYPVSGGTYSIIRYVLPKPLTYLGIASFVLISLITPPSIAIGVATYVQLLFPQLPQTAFATSCIAAVCLIFALMVGLSSIATSDKMTKVLMAMQAILIAVLFYIFLANPQRDVTEVVFSPQVLNELGTALIPGSISVVLASIGMLFGVIGGYDAALGFSEETKGSCKNIAKAVIISSVVTVIFMVTPIILSMVAAPDLLAYLQAKSPLLYTVQSYLGSTGTTLVNIGVLIAAFNATVMLIVWQARILYTGARDRAFPDFIAKQMMKVSGKAQVPWVATAFICIASIILVFASSLVALVTFGAILFSVMFLLVAVASIISRMKEPNIERPFKMPLFPLIPIVVIIGLSIAIFAQPLNDILTAAGFYGLALLYYFVYIRPRDKREKQS
ncbi:APC family permease [uncultured Brevibacillus sp.]|uniref:APC family permease n=1 Tax=uncultured Brevibacillus sp. TaxID=169970 RepID=UPI00259568A2|nr:APC family permease [uncultured Brevibacillus sp.]